MKFLNNLDGESLANQIYKLQKENGWPGLAKEAFDMAQEVDIMNPNDENMTYKEYKKELKMKIKDFNKRLVDKESEKLSKLDEMKQEPFGLKKYLKDLSFSEARTLFKYKSKMIDAK